MEVDAEIAMRESDLGGEVGAEEWSARGDGDAVSLVVGRKDEEVTEEPCAGVGVVTVVEAEMEANAEKVCG